MKRPYLSIVLTGRNDDYGGDFRSRLERSVKNTSRLLNSHDIDSEIIFVNYNPIGEDAPIEEFIDWPTGGRNTNIRLVTVPNEVHKELVSLGNRMDVPVIEYLGKNAGIRRANGEFILSMNPDIIIPEKLMAKLKHLNEQTYYRADRVDFSGDFHENPKYTRIFLKGHDYAISSLGQLPAIRLKNRIINCWITCTPKIERLLNRISLPVYYDNSANRYHCNVSGDFMLMHRNHWFKLNGHHEHTEIALHVDSLMVIQAATLGLKERVFREPVYHQEHKRRYDASEVNSLYERVFKYFVSESNEMLQRREAKVYNDEHWGLSKFELPETKI